jgi:hypothetical protein
MVQLVAVALVGGLGWYAYRAFQKHMAAIGEELEKSEKAKKDKAAKTASADELELGPDGVYRLKSDKLEDKE